MKYIIPLLFLCFIGLNSCMEERIVPSSLHKAYYDDKDSTNQTENSTRYGCVNGNCQPDPNGSFFSLGACQSVCRNDIGFNCVGGNCQPVTGGGSYSSLNDCQNNCGGSGKVSFYGSFYPNCTFSVLCVANSTEKEITQYYSSGINHCDFNGCANFKLPPATYQFRVYCDGYYQFDRNVTITLDDCEIVKLF